jgi:hypothetical protein
VCYEIASAHAPPTPLIPRNGIEYQEEFGRTQINRAKPNEKLAIAE